MADPKTIFDYATTRNAGAQQAVADAQQQLADAQAALVQVNAERQEASSDLASLEGQAASIRQKLSVIVTPADGAALLDALEQTTIRIRAQQAAIVKIQERFSVIQAGMAQAQTSVAAATAEQQEAAAALAGATGSNEDREALSTALGSAPLTNVNLEAGKALDAANPVEGAAFKKATERIKKDIPAKLFERAQARREQASVLVSQDVKNNRAAEDAVLKERATNGGVKEVAAQALTIFKRAEAAARDFAGGAQTNLDGAKAALAEVGDPNRSPLTPEQEERIHDPALATNRNAAVDEEATLETTLGKDVSDKQALLDEAILKAKAEPSAANEQAVVDARDDLSTAQDDYDAANQTWREKEELLAAAVEAVEAKKIALAAAIQQAVTDGNDPDTDPDVGLARTALTTAQNNLKTAEDAYKGSPHGRLDLWESAVPDTTWRLFEKYQDAVEILNTLKTSNPATLKGNLQTTEETYVAAQLTADKSANILAQLTAEQLQRAARQEGAQKTADARLFSALRGDE
jgi:hypothetical protein